MKNDLFETASIPSAYFQLSLPVMFSMIISIVYNMVDTYFIAKTGSTSLVAGVSLCAPIFSLLIAVGDIFGLGGSSAISRLFGQQRMEDGKRLSVFCFYGAILFGLVMTAVLLGFRLPILSLLGAQENTLPYAAQYYSILAVGAPLVVLNFSPSNLLRTEGLATASMVGTVSGSIINVILDPIFISVLGLGAAGAAIATVIGYLFSDLFFVYILLRRSSSLSIHPKLLHISGGELWNIVSIGIPASVTNLMQSIGIMLTNRFLLPYGTSAVAAMGIALKVNMISVLILVAFAFGGQPLIGYTYGAKNFQKLRSILKFTYLFETGIALAFTTVLSLMAPQLIRIFMDDPEILSMGIPMLRMQLISMVCIGLVLSMTTTFQSTGKALGALTLSISRQGLIFAAVIAVLSRSFGFQGVICAQPVSDFITLLIAIVMFIVSFKGELFGRMQI